MYNELDNPFSVTKATEFSDSEINEYWVNFNTTQEISIEALLNTQEYVPKYLIGGKGCGKTHILRFFSFQLQKIRHQNAVEEILSKDKYIGLYSVFHGLNSSRFSGKGIEQSQWESVFEYYFELYICDNLLNTIKEIFSILSIEKDKETAIVKNILLLFSNYKELESILTIDHVIYHLSELRRKIDSQVLNAAFTRNIDIQEVKVLFSPGDLLFGIPSNISKIDEHFKDVKFIYIFDEYEKLYEWQKVFVNSLVWDKKNPVTFWIGARRYGYTTRKTKTGQEMKSGSEFQDVNLDEIIRKNEILYKKFAEKLFTNRLEKFYERRRLAVESDILKENFEKKFEAYNEEKILDEIVQKNQNEFKHLRDLRKKIRSAITRGQSLNIKNNDEIDSIISRIELNTHGNPLEQKYKLFNLYKLWSKADKKSSLNDLVDFVNAEYDKYIDDKPSTFDEIVDKRKKDLIAQLTKENNVKNTEYSGIDSFIKISQGNARSFILILKKAIEFANIKGERPLEEGGKISLDSQYLAVYDTAKWFYEDAEVVGEVGKNMYVSLKRLTDYFILERFCDKPVETTVSCFYVKVEDLSQESRDCIEIMKMHSILIENDDGRLEKNSGRKERMFQINKVLSPLWNLPTVTRGSLAISIDLAEAIFNSSNKTKFDHLFNVRKAQLNAPDFTKFFSEDLGENLFSTKS